MSRSFTQMPDAMPGQTDKPASQYIHLAKSAYGSDSDVIHPVMEVTGEDAGALVVDRPSADSLPADKVVLCPAHIVPNDELIRAAHVPFEPCIAFYDDSANNGAPTVGCNVGTIADSFKLSTDAVGFIVTAVDTTEKLVWVLPAHSWGGLEDPYDLSFLDDPSRLESFEYQNQDGETVLWDRRDPPTGTVGVTVTHALGVWEDEAGTLLEHLADFHYCAFGHLQKIDNLRTVEVMYEGSSTPDEQTTETSTSDGTTGAGAADWSVNDAGSGTNCTYTKLTNTNMLTSYAVRLGDYTSGSLTAEVSGLAASTTYTVSIRLVNDSETSSPYDPTNSLSVNMEGNNISVSQSTNPTHEEIWGNQGDMVQITRQMTTDANGKLQLSASASAGVATWGLHCKLYDIRGWA